jgi:phosphatidate cytidylyltransferase
MALNVQAFKTRSATALVFVIVMLAGLLVHVYGFIALFLIIMIGCIVEFTRLLRKIVPENYLFFILLALLYIILPIFLMIQLGTNEALTDGRGGLKGQPIYFSPLFPVAIICSIWINDTMAYIVGSFIGRTPFSSISPKKTWEGTVGGALLCVIVIGILGSALPIARSVELRHWIAIASICAVFGTVGDLLESKLKRMAKVKDSGSFMPGHGGFLDRFDSLLVATTFVWLYIWIFM